MAYLTEAHRKNSEGAMRTIAKSKKRPFTYEDALKQQKRNSKDPLHEANDKT